MFKITTRTHNENAQSPPTEILRDDILPALGLSVTDAAKQLGVNRVTLSRLLNGKSAITAEMALRLHAWLGENSPSPESWLHQQADYDLWQAKQKNDFAYLNPQNLAPFNYDLARMEERLNDTFHEVPADVKNATEFKDWLHQIENQHIPNARTLAAIEEAESGTAERFTLAPNVDFMSQLLQRA